MEYITRPEILFMDEPDSGVDGSMVMEVMTTLREITDEGKKSYVLSLIHPIVFVISLTRSWWLERVRKDAEDFVTLDLLTMR